MIIVSTSGPDLSRFRLGLVRLVTRSAKAKFGQVGDQVRKVKDQVGQDQGQELDNMLLPKMPLRKGLKYYSLSFFLPQQALVVKLYNFWSF